MAICYLCKKKLGLFKKASFDSEMRSKENPEVHDLFEFCRNCAKMWPEKHKNLTLTALLQSREPVQIFKIRKVQTLDQMGAPGMFSNKLWYLLGDLLFLDKGVCFAALSRYKYSASLRFSPTRIAREIVLESKAWHALNEHDKTYKPKDLLTILRQAERLIFFPKRTINRINYNSWAGLKIDASDRFWDFDLYEGEKTFKQFHSQISSYLHSTFPAQ